MKRANEGPGAPVHLRIPLEEAAVRGLRCGDQVRLSGLLHTARDAVHRYLHGCPDALGGLGLEGGALYHCGPVVVPDGAGGWRVVAAGPTTSIREEPYLAELIAGLGLRAVVGKGGMGERTRLACRRHGCVYLHAVGGCAQVLAESIVRVEGVRFLERFGAPEAMWALRVEGFPATVTIDAAGGSLHARVAAASGERLRELLGSGS